MNNLINSIDLDLNSAEIKSLISDIKLSLGFVVDSNHTDDTDRSLGIGEILVKSLDMAGTSEISDSVYKPLNTNMTNIPIAGEFVIVMETPLGRYYINSVNLFNNESENIDRDNLSGYVSFTDDENTNKKQIGSDSKNRKSVLENNQPPFDRDFKVSNSYDRKFGDVSLFGRFGNRITLTSSERNDGEIHIDSGISSIQLNNGVVSYISKAITKPPAFISNTIGSSQFDGEQIFLDSDRVYITVGKDGIIQETSGVYSIVSDDFLSIKSSTTVTMEGTTIDMGVNADNRVILGDKFTDDFRELMESMVRFAETLKKQDKIISLSNAANNFLTDLSVLGWDNFNQNNYLSNKVYVEQ